MTLKEKEVTSKELGQIRKLIEKTADLYNNKSFISSWDLEEVKIFSDEQSGEDSIFAIDKVKFSKSVLKDWVEGSASYFFGSNLKRLPEVCYNLWLITRYGSRGEEEITKIYSDEKIYEGAFTSLEAIHKKRDQLIENLKNEKAKVPTFEKEIKRLTNLIKEQKEKIINAYTHFFTEKELLKELITAHLEYMKAKKQGLDTTSKLRKPYNKIYDKLEEKIGEAKMNEVEQILNDCETLIHYETELQTQITNNQKLIENHQSVINQITYNIGNLNLNQGNALIGNTLGNQTNLGYQLTEVLETKVTVPKREGHALQPFKPN